MVKYYIISTALAFLNLAYISFGKRHKSLTQSIIILLLIVTLSNAGYLALGTCKSVETAVLANKIAYLGGCFIPPVLFFILCRLCNYDLKKWAKITLFTYSSIVYFFVLTTGHFNIYYKSMEYARIFDAGSLAIEPGLMYPLFYGILIGYTLANMILLVYTYINKQSVSRKNLTLLAILEGITVITFIVGRAINPLLELMPFVYVIDGWFLIILHQRLLKYNVYETVLSSLEQNQLGYIILDEQLNFLGCNDFAIQVLPLLKNSPVDKKLKDEGELKIIYEWVKGFKKNSSFSGQLEKNEKIYTCNLKKIKGHKGKLQGYVLELQDETDKHKYLALMKEYTTMLQSKVTEQTSHITEIQNKIILGLANIVENRDGNTGGHIKRTSDVVEILLNTITEYKLFDFSSRFVKDLIRAAPMHDLGKIGVDDSILRKPGRLTEDEFEKMQTHPEMSAKICEEILRGVEEDHFVNVAKNVARHHHEKWNGLGYPDGLKGEEIPIEARIMAIADVYDALVSKRCYKEPMSFSQAYDVMIDSMGNHFDPSMQKVFELSVKQLEDYYSRI